MTDNFHGTHVAGTAAATADNNEGTAGVAPEAEIMAVRVLDGDGSGSTTEIARESTRRQNGADVINMSLGGPSGSGDKAMSDAIKAAGEAESSWWSAAGNEELTTHRTFYAMRAARANLICVAAPAENSESWRRSRTTAPKPSTWPRQARASSAPRRTTARLLSDDFIRGSSAPGPTTASDGGLLWGQFLSGQPAAVRSRQPGWGLRTGTELFKNRQVEHVHAPPLSVRPGNAAAGSSSRLNTIESFFTTSSRRRNSAV